MKALWSPRALAFGLWLAVLTYSFVYLSRFNNTPGETIAPRLHFGEKLARPLMLVFLHPHCKCSSATLAELERLLPIVGDSAEIRIAFTVPHGEDASWAKSGLLERAKTLKSVDVHLDTERLASYLGAKTSGTVFLFDKTGDLVFEGGITPSRGHEGDSPGKFFIMDWLTRGQSSLPDRSLTFGCELEG